MRKTINTIIDTTKKFFGEYFERTCAQRLAGGAGSIFEDINSIEKMEKSLRTANWSEATHQDVMPGCKAYKTTSIKGGRLGLVKIEDLPENVRIIASDPKGTGKVSMTVHDKLGPIVEETWLITGIEEGHEIIFTFHPGEPVRPSILEVKNCPDGTILSKEEAINLGFNFAKIV